jgi:hypothetical protein
MDRLLPRPSRAAFFVTQAASLNTIRTRLGHESLDVTLAYLKGRDAESEDAGTCEPAEQEQPGAVRITTKAIITGDFWLSKPRSPVLAFGPLVSELSRSGNSDLLDHAAPITRRTAKNGLGVGMRFTVFTKTWRFESGQPLPGATACYRGQCRRGRVFTGFTCRFFSIVGKTKMRRVKIPYRRTAFCAPPVSEPTEESRAPAPWTWQSSDCPLGTPDGSGYVQPSK